MIFTERQITVHKGKSSINEPVILYRGDYEVSIKFTIIESKFRFKSGVNLVDSEKASFGQLAILAPYGGNVFSEVVKCEDGTVTFTLTKEMIDQLEEVGLYSFQIRLFDYYRESRVSIPPVEFGIEVREPVASEDHDNTVNNAIVGYSIAKVVDGLNEDVSPTFDDEGQYNKTDWETGDRISEGKLNKIEDALDQINQNEKNDKAAMDKVVASNYNVLMSNIDTKADISYVNNRINTIMSGSPKGAYATVSALTAAIPNGNSNIYVVNADGYWYYWSGTAWTKGGVYQSSIPGDNSIELKHLKYIDFSDNFYSSSVDAKMTISKNDKTCIITIKGEYWVNPGKNISTGEIAKPLYFGNNNAALNNGWLRPVLLTGSCAEDYDVYTFELPHNTLLLWNMLENSIRAVNSNAGGYKSHDVLLAFCHDGILKGGVLKTIYMDETTRALKPIIDNSTSLINNNTSLINNNTSLINNNTSLINQLLSNLDIYARSWSSVDPDMEVVSSGYGYGHTVTITIPSSVQIWFRFGNRSFYMGMESSHSSGMPNINGVGEIDESGNYTVTIAHNQAIIYDINTNSFNWLTNGAVGPYKPGIALVAFSHNGELKGGIFFEFYQWLRSNKMESQINTINDRIGRIEGDVNFNPQGNPLYSYHGEKIDLNPHIYYTEALFSLNRNSSPVVPTGAPQGFDIYNDVVCQFYGNNCVILYEYGTGNAINGWNAPIEHSDTAQFSNEFYDSADEFPLIYTTADSNPARVLVFRIDRVNAPQLIRTYSFPLDKTGYYAGHAMDFDTNICYQVGYTENSYYINTSGKNDMIVTMWDMNKCTADGDGNLVPTLIKSFTLPFMITVQGQKFFNGKLYLLSSHWADADTIIYGVDCDRERICTVIDEFPNNVKQYESEDICFRRNPSTGAYELHVLTTYGDTMWKIVQK